ncbi:MAG TPA: PIN domain-containing protein [Woeseiaceae bacterium]|nr:PIN domain-containing protein [Woeseiaceae bacterium]
MVTKGKKSSKKTSRKPAEKSSATQAGTTSGGKYVLVDFENVQPKNLELLKEHPFRVLVFIGANQNKFPRHFVVAMQALGEQADYVEIAGSGPNALDFHIAYYIGELAAQEPDAQFHIISKDRGFDPLIRHLKGKKIRVRREKDLAEIPELRIPDSTSRDEQIDAIVKNLRQRGHSRPRKVKTLQNTINTLFTTKLDQAELDAITDELRKRNLIVVKQNNVSYRLK